MDSIVKVSHHDPSPPQHSTPSESHSLHALIYDRLSLFLLTEKQLGLNLTAALAIPLADGLPTHNSRKTCALAIWLIQAQRLPADVLQPAASGIAYALRRGIDRELRKEGDMGSANNGIKVHIFSSLFSYHNLDFFVLLGDS
jgi:hypothetical protein